MHKIGQQNDNVERPPDQIPMTKATDGILAVVDICFEIPEGSLFTLRGPKKNVLFGDRTSDSILLGIRDAFFLRIWSG